MKTLKIKTWLPVFPGFYNTIFEPDETNVIEDPYTFEDYDFDYDYYNKSVSKHCVIAVQNKLKEIGFNCKMEFEQLRSPREYNFANDAIDIIVKITPAFITKLEKFCHLSTFAAYLERYKSCSGFISHYSHYTSDWLTYINAETLQDNPHILGALLEFVLEIAEYDSEQLYNDVSDYCYLFGDLKESSKPTEFELNGVLFVGNLEDVELEYPYYWNSDLSFFEYCLATLKQIVIQNPNQLSFNF